MDVNLNVGDLVIIARQPTNGQPNFTETATAGRIMSTTAFQPSHISFVSVSDFFLFFTVLIIVFFQKPVFYFFVLQLTPKTRFYGQWEGNWALSHPQPFRPQYLSIAITRPFDKALLLN